MIQLCWNYWWVYGQVLSALVCLGKSWCLVVEFWNKQVWKKSYQQSLHHNFRSQAIDFSEHLVNIMRIRTDFTMSSIWKWQSGIFMCLLQVSQHITGVLSYRSWSKQSILYTQFNKMIKEMCSSTNFVLVYLYWTDVVYTHVVCQVCMILHQHNHCQLSWNKSGSRTTSLACFINSSFYSLRLLIIHVS